MCVGCLIWVLLGKDIYGAMGDLVTNAPFLGLIGLWQMMDGELSSRKQRFTMCLWQHQIIACLLSALRRVNPRGRDKRGSFLKLCGQGKEGAKK